MTIAPLIDTTPKVATHSLKTDDGDNFIRIVQKLMDTFLTIFSRFSEKDRGHVDKLKKAFHDHSETAAAMQIRIGNAAPWIAFAGCATAFPQIFLPQNIAPLAQLVSNQVVPGVGNVYTSHLQADQMRTQAEASVTQTELSAATQKTQSQEELRQSISGILERVLEVLRRASS